MRELSVSRNIYNQTRLVAGVLVFLSAVFLCACKSDYPGGGAQAKPVDGKKGEARPVKVVQVAQTPVGEGININGTFAVFDQTTISAKIAGRLETVTVDLGGTVQKGQLIARLETRDYQMRVQQAEAAVAQARTRVGLSPAGDDDRINPEKTGIVTEAKAVLENAKLTRDRSAELVREGVVARAEYDTALANFRVAESRYQDALEEIRNRQALIYQRRLDLAQTRQQLSDAAIYAPVSGKVETKRASVGEFVAAGAPLVDIVRINPLRFRAEVPERETLKVRVGQPLRLSVDGTDRVYIGYIARLSPSITQQNRVLVVEADIANDGTLRPGAFVRAVIVTNAGSTALTVPADAVINFAGIEKVILVKDGKALEKPVTTGRRIGDSVEIIDGLNLGDTVVVKPGNLQSGQPVKVE